MPTRLRGWLTAPMSNATFTPSHTLVSSYFSAATCRPSRRARGATASLTRRIFLPLVSHLEPNLVILPWHLTMEAISVNAPSRHIRDRLPPKDPKQANLDWSAFEVWLVFSAFCLSLPLSTLFRHLLPDNRLKLAALAYGQIPLRDQTSQPSPRDHLEPA